MSFVKKALKKVWNVTKKVVKSKVFKYVAIAAAIFFTAGVAAGGWGFAAFEGVSSIGGFFTAVGQTMATGAAAMAGGLGLSGVSSSLAAYGGQAAAAAGLAGAPALMPSLGAIAAQGITATATGASAGVAGYAGTGFLGAAGAASTGMSPATGQIIATGISGAFTAMASGERKQKQPNGYVAGGLARGGGDTPPPPIHYSVGEPTEMAAGEAPEAGLVGAPEDPSVAAQAANTGLAPPPMDMAPAPADTSYAQDTMARIRSRIQQPTSAAPAQAPIGAGLVQQQQEQQQQGYNFGPFQNKATQIGGLVQRRV